MSKAVFAKASLVLAALPALIGMTACSPTYTAQREPGQLVSSKPVVAGREVVPGEANDYPDWQAGKPLLVSGEPSKSSDGKSKAPTTEMLGGSWQVDQQYPPYLRD